jgi:hypothetical protein
MARYLFLVLRRSAIGNRGRRFSVVSLHRALLQGGPPRLAPLHAGEAKVAQAKGAIGEGGISAQAPSRSVQKHTTDIRVTLNHFTDYDLDYDRTDLPVNGVFTGKT